MADVLSDYFAALERLKAGKPKNIPRGTKITSDAVALEAGRGKGSIKRSRLIFSDLIVAIREASAVQSAPQNEHKNRLEKAKNEAKQYRKLYEEGLARELSLLYEIEDLKDRIKKLKKPKVVRMK